ncbi:MAG: sialidase family protein [Blastocatellales bacterium]
MNKLRITLIVSLLLLPISALAQPRELPSPAGAGSGQPNLTVSPDGRVYLSWIERLGEGRFSLRFATLEKAMPEKYGWSEPRVIAEGANWFVNWADFPSMIALPDGSLAAHWLVKSGTGTYAYDVNISRSFDGGKTWSKPFVPHRDGTQTEHGFVSLFAAKDRSLAAVWLDGREMKAGEGGHGHGNMTLRYAKITRDGALTGEAALDAKVCECCQTSAAMTAEGPVVVYRDRSDQELRDISVIRLKDGKWSQPRSVAQDGWQLNGCPVNGPAVAASGRRVAVAWFTAAGNTPRVKMAFSNDAGATFGEPVTVDDGAPVGRVDVLLLSDGNAMVCWLEKLPSGGEVRVRRVMPDGKRDQFTTIAPSGTARSNGFPQMARAADTLVFAWTGARVFTATMPLPHSPASTPASADPAKVNLIRAPNGGIQPQAVIDERGVSHLVYFAGEPSAGDIFYVRRERGKDEFSSPIQVNSQPGSAIAVGTMRGAQIAIGKNGRVHVSWNGSNKAAPRGPENSAPMLYARMNDAKTAFEAQRNLMQVSHELDGGGTVAADKAGNVYVAWHGAGERKGEEHRSVWLARSTDEGKTFAREAAAFAEETGACGCCGMRAFVDSRGALHMLYRTATNMTERGTYLLTSTDKGKSFRGTRLDNWHLTSCPMSTATMTVNSDKQTLAAWENNGQVYFGAIDSSQKPSPTPAPATTGKRKHPAIATNMRGETILVWTEGTGWKKGGSLAWQVFDKNGKPVGEMGAAQGVPVWGLASVVPEADGSFTVIY